MPGSTRVSVTESAWPLAKAASPAPARPQRSATRDEIAAFWRHFRANRIGMAGAVPLLVVVVVAVLAPVIAPYAQDKIHTNWRLYPPNEFFLLGTDELDAICSAASCMGRRFHS